MTTPECVDYVTALITKGEDTVEHQIGSCVKLLDDREAILDYITGEMTVYTPGSRGFEVAQEIWLLLDGYGVAA